MVILYVLGLSVAFVAGFMLCALLSINSRYDGRDWQE